MDKEKFKLDAEAALVRFYQRIQERESISPQRIAEKEPQQSTRAQSELVTRTSVVLPPTSIRKVARLKKEEDERTGKRVCYGESIGGTAQAPIGTGSKEKPYCFRALRYTYDPGGGAFTNRTAYSARAGACTPANPISWFFTPSNATLAGLIAPMVQPPVADGRGTYEITFYFECTRITQGTPNGFGGTNDVPVGPETGSGIYVFAIFYR